MTVKRLEERGLERQRPRRRRRGAVQAVLTSSGGGRIGCWGGLWLLLLMGCTTPANHALDRLEAQEFADLRRVEKVPAPGAERLLLHVRQTHLVDPAVEAQLLEEALAARGETSVEEVRRQHDRLIREGLLKDTLPCQQSLYRLIPELLEAYEVEGVFVEGLTADSSVWADRASFEECLAGYEEDSERLWGEFEAEIQRVERVKAITEDVLDPEETGEEARDRLLGALLDRGVLEFGVDLERELPFPPLEVAVFACLHEVGARSIAEALSETLEQYEEFLKVRRFHFQHFVFEGVFRLFLEGRLELLPGERAGSTERLLEVLPSEGGTEEYQEVVFRTREDYILEEVGARSPGVYLVIFGAAHSWEDNVRAWNEAHPDRPISLGTLTPAGFRGLVGVRAAR